ncbi:hypothetical protein TWF718_003478 [Orbilia javanica]|uniref:Uncharacterized protein n=1 Tax=Orbilia javanica TaxID=47235 RepID=A0AAN8ML97_9PEZI
MDGTGIICWGNSCLMGNSARSTTGTDILCNGRPIIWMSKPQSIVAHSTCQAELIALEHATKEITWPAQLATSLNFIPRCNLVTKSKRFKTYDDNKTDAWDRLASLQQGHMTMSQYVEEAVDIFEILGDSSKVGSRYVRDKVLDGLNDPRILREFTMALGINPEHPRCSITLFCDNQRALAAAETESYSNNRMKHMNAGLNLVKNRLKNGVLV